MTQKRITRFAKRLNVVLRAAGWPAAPYVGGPDPYALNLPASEVTIVVDNGDLLGPDRFTLTIRRSDRPNVSVRVEALEERYLNDLIPDVRIMNALVRRVKWALA